VKRWILWNLRCRRGRRCAHLIADPTGEPLPPRWRIRASYTCSACGTDYEHWI